MNRKVSVIQRHMEQCFDYIARNRMSQDPVIHTRMKRRLKFIEKHKYWLGVINLNHFRPH